MCFSQFLPHCAAWQNYDKCVDLRNAKEPPRQRVLLKALITCLRSPIPIPELFPDIQKRTRPLPALWAEHSQRKPSANCVVQKLESVIKN